MRIFSGSVTPRRNRPGRSTNSSVKNIVVFASGSGTNFQAIIDAVESGEIDARITGLVAGGERIGAVRRAEKAGIPFRVITTSDIPDGKTFADELLHQLKQWRPDLIVLAGYLKQIPADVIKAYPSGIVNIHPSLLPKFGGKGFYGILVHRAVLEADEKESGCTVHLVDEEYDRGPILAQQRVPVLPDDTPESLAERIRREEHKLYPRVIQQLLTRTNTRNLGSSTS